MPAVSNGLLDSESPPVRQVSEALEEMHIDGTLHNRRRNATQYALNSAQLPNNVIDLDALEEAEYPAIADHRDDPLWSKPLDLDEENEKDHTEYDNSATSTSGLASRSMKLTRQFVLVDKVDWKGEELGFGVTVELLDQTFLLIRNIFSNTSTGQITLRGYLLRRTRQVKEFHISGRNELIFNKDSDQDHKRRESKQHFVDVQIHDVKKTRDLVQTNLPFPKGRYNPNFLPRDMTNEQLVDYIEEHMVLVVRKQRISVYKSRRDRDLCKHPVSQRLLNLTFQQCDKSMAMLNVDKRASWRGETIQKGAARPTGLKPQRYTYGDIFCGAGGATRGAANVGFKISYGVDWNKNCKTTWEHNFYRSEFHHLNAFDFINLPERFPNEFKVDVLHISPPCQVHSPIHTVAGQNDEVNLATLFAVLHLIQKCKPRFVTLEQTSGIVTHDKVKGAYKSLLRMFTDLGFSVHTQLVDFQGFGLPSTRRRLIIIAACPGEVLPDFPGYTHGPGYASNYVTPRSVFQTIPADAPNNERKYIRAVRKAWDDTKLAKCVTCNGGGNPSYPDGSRGLTHREIAVLQGFPPHVHEFKGFNVRGQIGNSFPPVVAQQLFEHLKIHMLTLDEDLIWNEPILVEE